MEAAGVEPAAWGRFRIQGWRFAPQALGAAAQYGTPLEQRHAQAFTRMTANLGKNLAVARVRANERMH